MGHHSSPAWLGGHGGIPRADRGASRPVARRIDSSAGARRPERSFAGNELSTRLCLLAVRAYQSTLSVFFRGSCRFQPSCSQYALEAIERHGARRGAWLALTRLLRCQPFAAAGFDPVPQDGSESSTRAGHGNSEHGNFEHGNFEHDKAEHAS